MNINKKKIPGKREFARACLILAAKSHPLTSNWDYKDFTKTLRISKTTYFRDAEIAEEIKKEIESKKNGAF